MIVVSHRGPYRFEQTDAGAFVAHRGAGGLVSALSPLLSLDHRRDMDRGGDERRRPRRRAGRRAGDCSTT